MSGTATRSGTESFDLTNAKELAAKLVADLLGCQAAYRGVPSNERINALATEVTYLLRDGYLAKLEVGFFESDWKRRLTWMYTVSGTTLANGGVPGGITPNFDISGTSFQSLVWWTPAWRAQSDTYKANYYEPLVSKRTGTVHPTDGSGSWSTQTIGYSSGGTLLTRTSFSPS